MLLDIDAGGFRTTTFLRLDQLVYLKNGQFDNTYHFLVHKLIQQLVVDKLA